MRDRARRALIVPSRRSDTVPDSGARTVATAAVAR
jgi:hypothetical protein